MTGIRVMYASTAAKKQSMSTWAMVRKAHHQFFSNMETVSPFFNRRHWPSVSMHLKEKVIDADQHLVEDARTVAVHLDHDYVAVLQSQHGRPRVIVCGASPGCSDASSTLPAGLNLQGSGTLQVA